MQIELLQSPGHGAHDVELSSEGVASAAALLFGVVVVLVVRV